MMRSLGDGSCGGAGKPGDIGGAMQLIHDANSGFSDRSRDARDAEETRWLVDAIAAQMCALYGREGGRLDWPAVERHLGLIVERARSEADIPTTGGGRAFGPRAPHAAHDAVRRPRSDRSIRGRARRRRPPPRPSRSR